MTAPFNFEWELSLFYVYIPTLQNYKIFAKINHSPFYRTVFCDIVYSHGKGAVIYGKIGKPENEAAVSYENTS